MRNGDATKGGVMGGVLGAAGDFAYAGVRRNVRRMSDGRGRSDGMAIMEVWGIRRSL